MQNADTTKILVVDDLPEKLLAYRVLLEELGQQIVAVGSGEAALAQVLRSEFAVILLDVQMPGLNGFETAAMIRKRKRSAHTPIIFLTAFADEVRAAEGYAHGAVDYISTPVVPEILRAKVRVFVDLYKMTQQVKRQAEERVALAEERTKRATAEEATRRSTFLADVSRALADSLDPETTIQTLASQCVPFLSDLAGVTVAGDHGQPWRTELAWASRTEREPHTRRLTSPDGPRDELREAVERTLTCGRTARLEGLDLPYPAAADEAIDEANRIRSAVLFPLRARGRTLGVLTLALGPSGRRHEPADITVGEDLASRAAIALDNARLYKDVERADRQKNEFLSMLAHELRNPLAPIRNAAEVLRLKAPDLPDLQWARGVIDRQLRHLVRLVDDLLDVSRITRGKIRLALEPLDLGTVVGHAVEASRPAIEDARHRLDVSTPAEAIWVNGDHARLTQVLTNLLNNAAKYTDPGGRISLSVTRDNDAATIRVRDTGIGIPAELLGAVFELFTQAERALDRSQGGLGVGLTLVRRLVELHGGTVHAVSDGPGHGSEFVVQLPLLTADRQPASKLAVRPPDGRSRLMRVLVVDDNADAADSLTRLLRLEGHLVRTAHDWPAVAAVVPDFAPDVVLLDIGLPRVNGYEVARRLRAAAEGSPPVLVAVTGYGRDEDRQLAREAGFAHHLVKPVEPEALHKLFATISIALDAGQPDVASAAR